MISNWLDRVPVSVSRDRLRVSSDHGGWWRCVGNNNNYSDTHLLPPFSRAASSIARFLPGHHRGLDTGGGGHSGNHRDGALLGRPGGSLLIQINGQL